VSRKFIFFFLLFLLCFSPVERLYAQTGTQSTASGHFDMTGFPQWTKDLRRAEIVALGSFPFMYLFTNTGIGLAGQDQSELGRTIAIAAGGAVTIAFVDFVIERYKRSVREKEARKIPDGEPIITIRPIDNP
jgi:hypothetical protein